MLRLQCPPRDNIRPRSERPLRYPSSWQCNDDIVLASIEYAAEHLNSPLIMVLGHTNCGAVQATLEEDKLDGHLSSIAQAIEEAVEETSGLEGDVLNQTVRIHARITANT